MLVIDFSMNQEHFGEEQTSSRLVLIVAWLMEKENGLDPKQMRKHLPPPWKRCLKNLVVSAIAIERCYDWPDIYCRTASELTIG